MVNRVKISYDWGEARFSLFVRISHDTCIVITTTQKMHARNTLFRNAVYIYQFHSQD